jgi:SM-20-related protein
VPPDGAALADAIGQGLAGDGRVVVPGFVADDLVRRLRARARTLDRDGRFAPAGVGRAGARVERIDIRGDRIAWLDPSSTHAAERELAAALDDVRLAANRALALGAFDGEFHYAIYPPGAGYARHRDRFRDDDARVLSCIVYLNLGWRDGDGGHLRFHDGDGASTDVRPGGGTLVAFLADRHEHEVLPARRERMSISGWFRRRVG